MKTYLVKVDDAMYADWQAQAKAAGIKLAELIRKRMNGARGGAAKYPKNATQNARRLGGSKPRRRSTGVAAERIRTPDSATVALEVQKRANELRALPDIGGTDHHPSCPCGVCEWKRKNLKK